MDNTETVTKHKLIEDLKVVATDVEELLRVTASQTGERVAQARARAEDSLRAVKEQVAAASDSATEKARAAALATDHYVHDNPWRSIGIAAGVGFLIGCLISRR